MAAKVVVITGAIFAVNMLTGGAGGNCYTYEEDQRRPRPGRLHAGEPDSPGYADGRPGGGV